MQNSLIQEFELGVAVFISNEDNHYTPSASLNENVKE